MMTAFILLSALTVVLVLTVGIRHTAAMHRTIVKHVSKGHISQAVSALLVTAQLSEVTRVLQHVTLVHMVISVFILAMILATKGTEAELH